MDFTTLVEMGHDILSFMSKLAKSLTASLSSLLPWDISGITTAVPILGELLEYSLLDVMIGVGLPLVIGYTLIKWLLP